MEKIGEAADAIKSKLPFGGKENESASITMKEQTKQDVSSSIDTIFKDAPLGVRMMGKMIKPIISSIAGNLAETMAEQSRQMKDILDDARGLIVQDNQAIQLLGEPIEIGSPFSQSSSTMSVNGQTRSNIQASFEVRGGRASGIVTIVACDGQINSLDMNIAGRNIVIDTTRRAGSSSTFADDTMWESAKSSSPDGLGKNRQQGKPQDIIDVEFVDKKNN